MSKENFNKHEALHDDPDFYFDENNFSTVILHSEDFHHKHMDEIKNLSDLIISGKREDKDLALQILKKEDGRDLLLSAIANKNNKEHRALLIAACWESGLDFSNYLELFVLLILTGAYYECLEAVTVLEQMESKLPEETRLLAVKKLEEALITHCEKSYLYAQALEVLNKV